MKHVLASLAFCALAASGVSGQGSTGWVDWTNASIFDSHDFNRLRHQFLDSPGEIWQVDAIKFECLTTLAVVSLSQLPYGEVVLPVATDQPTPHIVFKCYSVDIADAATVKMSFVYDEGTIPGDEHTMKLFAFDMASEKWLTVAGSQLDTVANEISYSPLVSGGLYGIGVDLSQEHAKADTQGGTKPARTTAQIAGPPIAIGLIVFFALLFMLFRRRNTDHGASAHRVGYRRSGAVSRPTVRNAPPPGFLGY